MMEICGDNRFEIIERAKKHLLDATNIDTSADEMKVLDNFLFRCWQMGWLDRYDTADTPQTEQTEPTFRVDGIGDDDPTIHAIAHLQKVGWLQEHDRALTEPSVEEFVQGMKNLKAEIKGSERSVKGSDPLHDDCFDCDKFFTCDDKGEEYKTDCPWK